MHIHTKMRHVCSAGTSRSTAARRRVQSQDCRAGIWGFLAPGHARRCPQLGLLAVGCRAGSPPLHGHSAAASWILYR